MIERLRRWIRGGRGEKRAVAPSRRVPFPPTRRDGAAPPGLLPGAYVATGYRAAEVLRESGRPIPQGGTADRHLRLDRHVLARHAQELDRNNPLYKSILERSLDAILGRNGFSMQMRTEDPKLNAQVEELWRRWAEAPEVRGLFAWNECERLALRAILNTGDIGVARTNVRQIRYVEWEQITRSGGGDSAVVSAPGGSGNRIDQGVELDALDRPVAYWVAPYNSWGQVQQIGAERIAAADFILPGHRERVSQTRGVPALAHAMPLVHRLNDILDSEAIAWQQIARFSVAFNYAGSTLAGVDLTSADTDSVAQPPDLANRYLEAEQGTFFFGEPGETVQGIKRELPAAQFPASTRQFLELIGMSVGLPYSVLSLDYSRTTYTSSRAELEQAFRMFIRRQRELIRGHHVPITRWWLQWMIDAGELEARDYPFAWTAPEYPWIDQLSEAQAWGIRIDRGLATQREALASVGTDLEDWRAARVDEIRWARGAAAELSRDGTEQGEVDWRYLAGLQVSQTQSAVEAKAETEAEIAEGAEAAA